MKHTKTVDVPAVPATTTEVIVKTTCDFCGVEIKEKWGDVDAVSIARELGFKRSEGANYTVTTVDMCGSCFDTKLVPWFKSQGVETQETEIDW